MLRRPSGWLPLLLLAWVLPVLDRPPVLDEESYLAIGSAVAAHPLQPYHWWRAWQPWGATPAAHSYLYAHPPLHLWWMALWSPLGDGPAARLAAGLPWLLLLGASAGRLCERLAPRPTVAALAFALTPATALGVQATFMIDLPVVALGTAALAAWLGRRPGLAGALVGLAACTKYPALLLWVPVLAHGLARGDHRGLLRAAVAFAAVWGGVEALLWGIYGAPHLWEVLRTAGAIDRGPLAGRVLGVWLRLGLAGSLVAGSWAAGSWAAGSWAAGSSYTARTAALGAAAALVALGPVAGWDALGPADGTVVAVCGAMAGVVVGRLPSLRSGTGCSAVRLARHGGLRGTSLRPLARPRERAPGDAVDGCLLATWAVAVLAGVVIGHNYASLRYLWPASVPLVLLACRAATGPASPGLLASGGLAVALAWAETDYARAADAVARQVASLGTGRFTGEWAWRHRLEQEGWSAWVPGAPLEPGGLLAVPWQASPAEVPRERLEEVATFEAGGPSLRVVHAARRIGLHAETLGVLPFGLAGGPVEGATVYRVAR